MTADTVRAAGGVLWRPAAPGIEICVVHRPSLQDWSLPKGKLDGGERPLAGALREVLEETGVAGLPQLRLPQVAYSLPDGRAKTVDFWLMRAAGTAASPVADPAEVDEVTWLAPGEATGRLSYPDDRALVEQVAALPAITAVTLLVRHAKAGVRKAWTGDDNLRPVDELGRSQAAELGELLALFQPRKLAAATPLRCKQTLQPLADKLGLPIVADSAFAEPADPADVPSKVQPALSRLRDLRAGPAVAICSQGKMIPPMLAALQDAPDPKPYKTPKGDGWLLTWAGDRLLGLSRL